MNQSILEHYSGRLLNFLSKLTCYRTCIQLPKYTDRNKVVEAFRLRHQHHIPLGMCDDRRDLVAPQLEERMLASGRHNGMGEFDQRVRSPRDCRCRSRLTELLDKRVSEP